MDVAAKVTTKGQVTIPKPVRDALGIETGDHIVFTVEDGRAMISRTTDLLELAGVVDVPVSKRGADWDTVVRAVRSDRAIEGQ